MIRPHQLRIRADAPRRRPRPGLGWLLGAGLLTAACSRSPSDRAREAAAELHSWDATLRLLGDAESSGALPRAFAADARQAVERKRERSEAKLRQATAR